MKKIPGAKNSHEKIPTKKFIQPENPIKILESKKFHNPGADNSYKRILEPEIPSKKFL